MTLQLLFMNFIALFSTIFNNKKNNFIEINRFQSNLYMLPTKKKKINMHPPTADKERERKVEGDKDKKIKESRIMRPCNLNSVRVWS